MIERTYVLKFGLLPPKVGEKEVLSQIDAAHRYRNALIAVERDHRRLMQELETKFGLDVLQVQAAKVNEALENTEDKVERKELREQKKQLNKRISEVRSDLSFREQLHEIDGRSIEPASKDKEAKGVAETRNKKRSPNNSIDAKARRATRKGSKLHWGTYLVVERAMQASKKDKKGDPKFVRWDGSGQVGNQIQYNSKNFGMKGVDLFGDDLRGSITPRPDSWAKCESTDDLSRESYPMLMRQHMLRTGSLSERRRAGRVRLKMRIGGTTKDPIVAEWPMIMHKPIPEDALVRWVVVSRRRVGSKYIWSCEITLTESIVETEQPRDVAAVVFGWRKRGNRVRIAEWASPSGESGVLEVFDFPIKTPEMRRSNLTKVEVDGGYGGIVDGIRFVWQLTSLRRSKFNDALEHFVQWLTYQDKIPKWMAMRTVKKDSRVPTRAQATTYIGQWKSQGRLAALVNEWKENRIEGDDVIFRRLEAWRFEDMHLWNFEQRQDGSSRRRRKNLYRNFAANLTDKFGMLLIDGSNFKVLKEKEKKDKDKETGERLPGRRPATMSQMIAPGELREAIKQAAFKKGRVYEKMVSENSAQMCPKCGEVHKSHKDAEDGSFACSRCDYEGQVMKTRLLNMLSENGHEAAVQKIIERMQRARKKLLVLDSQITMET